jgi:putative redox protein
MVNISIRYTGDLHCAATHGPSQSEIATDAPVDNKGKGESFSPTDLVATALGSCMTVKVGKEMSKDAPRRIVALPTEVHIPLPPTTPQRAALEKIGLNCPVHKSLPAEIDRPTKFFWEGEQTA